MSDSADFIVDESATTTSLRPQGVTSFGLYFAPTQPGTRTGKIDIFVAEYTRGPLISLPTSGEGQSGCSVAAPHAPTSTALWTLALLLVTRRRAHPRQHFSPPL